MGRGEIPRQLDHQLQPADREPPPHRQTLFDLAQSMGEQLTLTTDQRHSFPVELMRRWLRHLPGRQPANARRQAGNP